MLTGKTSRRSVLVLFIPMLMLALVLQTVKLPGNLEADRPNLIILVLIFFALREKSRISIEAAWLTGLGLDFLNGAPLGLNAFLCSVQIYLISSHFRQFTNYAWWQQAVIIGCVNWLAIVLGYWIEHILGQSYYATNFFVPAAVTAAMWPLVYGGCKLLCQAFTVETKEEEAE